MKLKLPTTLLLILAMAVPGVAAAGHGLRSDNPGFICDLDKWAALLEDPYMLVDGNTNGKYPAATFFNPGTVVKGDSIHTCSPRAFLAKIWSTLDPGQAPNPASQPQSGVPQVARGAVMYEWVNEGTDPPLIFLLPPDVEVFVWLLPASTLLPDGAYEFELDNWCGLAPFADFTTGSQTAPNASSSITWNGNVYTAACAGFSGSGTSATDLLLDSTGVLIGYVDNNNNIQLTSTVPGWK